MAKSSKSSPRKRSASAKVKDEAAYAEILDTDTASDIAKKDDIAQDHEPVDSELDDVVADTASDQPDMAPEETIEQPAEEPVVTEREPLISEQSTSNGIFPSVLGGVIAGALGFVAAMLIFPDGWREKDDSLVTNLQSGLAEQKDNLTALTTQVSELSNLGGRLEGGLDALKSELSERAGVVTELGARLDRLSEGDGTVALPEDVQVLLNAQKEKIAALSDEVAGMAAAAKAQMQAAVDQQETAEQAEARVKARGAMQVIRLAMISGDPFEAALAEVAPAIEVPDGLQAVAADGAPTQTEIAQAYPAAARAALSKAIRVEAGDDTQSRLTLFLKDQLSARSLTPQDGDDADAVLSRAEAAVKAEDLATALIEIDTLPDVAKAEFGDWQALASRRQAAVDGFEAVSSALNGN